MKRVLPFIFSFIFLLFFFLIFQAFFPVKKAYSDELDDLNKKINELQSALDMSKRATAPFESQLINMRNQLAQIEQRVKYLESDIAEKRKTIDEGYKNLEKQKELLNKTVRNYYIKTYFFSPLVVFVSSDDASNITRVLAYQKREANRDKDIITSIALKIVDLEGRKKTLEDEESRLSATKSKLDSEKAEIEKLVGGAKAYQATLTNQIAQLSAKQQQLLAQKLGSLNLPTSLGAGPLFCTDDRKLDPGFSPAFAFYTFGIPHRVGMNQYGADGRARRANQNHEDILRTYFDNFSFETRSARIKVQGYGEMDLEEYMLGIYEMPNSFHIEALKAQVIAARSYALSYTNNGEKEICTTQACQVYKGGNKGGAWEQAVRETAGKVMVSGGQAITAWYASTAGGYTFTSADVGWNDRPWTKRLRDTDGEINSFEDLINKSYDKDSPCLYSAQGFRNEYAKSAWLKQDEAADIINVLLLAKADSSTQTHLSQPDKPNPDGVETWDRERVKKELNSKGITPYNSVSNFSVDWDKNVGKTNTITVSGNAGNNSFDGQEFKNYFNLRAPANIQIVGPLYNVEKR
ncbi:SpoIID/LytB domain-containing protein [Candidatus Parcubacteria bacterium]|nr:MAG: SpoIID/LytB domain-containing protein [Candidatus Parcubacteria bacterium]